MHFSVNWQTKCFCTLQNPSHDITSYMLHRWACMLRVKSSSVLSPHFGLPIILVKINLGLKIVFQKFFGSSLYFFANSNLASWSLLLMSDLHLVVWPLYLLSWSRLTVDWDTFTPALWRLLVMSLTDVFGVFFTALTLFLSSTTVVFLGRPVRCLLLSIPVVSSFLRTFQIVVVAMPNACPMALIDFLYFLNFKMASFSPIDNSLVFVLVYPL